MSELKDSKKRPKMAIQSKEPSCLTTDRLKRLQAAYQPLSIQPSHTNISTQLKNHKSVITSSSPAPSLITLPFPYLHITNNLCTRRLKPLVSLPSSYTATIPASRLQQLQRESDQRARRCRTGVWDADGRKQRYKMWREEGRRLTEWVESVFGTEELEEGDWDGQSFRYADGGAEDARRVNDGEEDVESFKPPVNLLTARPHCLTIKQEEEEKRKKAISWLQSLAAQHPQHLTDQTSPSQEEQGLAAIQALTSFCHDTDTGTSASRSIQSLLPSLPILDAIRASKQKKLQCRRQQQLPPLQQSPSYSAHQRTSVLYKKLAIDLALQICDAESRIDISSREAHEEPDHGAVYVRALEARNAAFNLFLRQCQPPFMRTQPLCLASVNITEEIETFDVRQVRSLISPEIPYEVSTLSTLHLLARCYFYMGISISRLNREGEGIGYLERCMELCEDVDGEGVEDGVWVWSEEEERMMDKVRVVRNKARREMRRLKWEREVLDDEEVWQGLWLNEEDLEFRRGASYR